MLRTRQRGQELSEAGVPQVSRPVRWRRRSLGASCGPHREALPGLERGGLTVNALAFAKSPESDSLSLVLAQAEKSEE